MYTKITLKVNKIMQISCSYKTLNLDNSSKITKFKKIFNFEFYAGRAF